MKTKLIIFATLLLLPSTAFAQWTWGDLQRMSEKNDRKYYEQKARNQQAEANEIQRRQLQEMEGQNALMREQIYKQNQRNWRIQHGLE